MRMLLLESTGGRIKSLSIEKRQSMILIRAETTPEASTAWGPPENCPRKTVIPSHDEVPINFILEKVCDKK